MHSGTVEREKIENTVSTGRKQDERRILQCLHLLQLLTDEGSRAVLGAGALLSFSL